MSYLPAPPKVCVASTHEGCDPNTCFKAKMRFWRGKGHNPWCFPYGQESWHDTTVMGEVSRDLAAAKANGITVGRPDGSFH